MTNIISAYDEEDGDFIFTRGSKRIKTQSSESESAPINASKRTLKSKEPPKQFENENSSTIKKAKEVKKCISTPVSENGLVIVSKRRKTTRSSSQKNKIMGPSKDTTGVVNDYDNKTKKDISYSDLTKKSTLVPLPLSDTPVMNRNKEFRKKARDSTNRRSSLGLRGRRASSLIDSGHSAIPHHEVETSDFYKHIEADGLSEPRRMKQLLSWIGERCMGSKPLHGNLDSTAELAGR